MPRLKQQILVWALLLCRLGCVLHGIPLTSEFVDENISLKCSLCTKGLPFINESGSTGLPVRNTCPKELLGESNLQVTVLYRDNVVKRRRKQGAGGGHRVGITATKDIREGFLREAAFELSSEGAGCQMRKRGSPFQVGRSNERPVRSPLELCPLAPALSSRFLPAPTFGESPCHDSLNGFSREHGGWLHLLPLSPSHLAPDPARKHLDSESCMLLPVLAPPVLH